MKEVLACYTYAQCVLIRRFVWEGLQASAYGPRQMTC